MSARKLFEPKSHEPLIDASWDPGAAEASIRAIARDADAALRGRDWWPLHPLDDDGETEDVIHNVYFGAAGVLLALQRLAEAGLHEPRHDYPALAGEVLESYRKRPELGGPTEGLWIGEGGIALVAWLLAPSDALADRLASLVVIDPETDALDVLWGSPGALVIAEVMLDRTGDERWRDAWNALADRLMGEWPSMKLLGAAHGMIGVVGVLAQRPDLLASAPLVGPTVAALSADAVRDGAMANWPPEAGGPLEDNGKPIRVQWCHGAPGIVTSVAGLPRDDELDGLLLQGGELTWAAGPLRKGGGLCHGTAGNGYAFLKLFTRTGDERWLERARRFAMHACAQVTEAREQYGRGRHTLWTGDPGTAMYLHACLTATSELPALDAW